MLVVKLGEEMDKREERIKRDKVRTEEERKRKERVRLDDARRRRK